MSFPTRPGAWEPKFDVSLIEPLLVTAQQLILRDQVEALAWSSPDRVLKPFQHVLLGRRDRSFWEDRIKNYPAVILAPLQTLPPESTDGNYLDSSHRIVAEIIIVGPDPNTLTIDVMRYVKAVDQMWRSASFADLTWNLKPNHQSMVVTDVIQHEYPFIFTDGPNAFMYVVPVLLTADYKEG